MPDDNSIEQNLINTPPEIREAKITAGTLGIFGIEGIGSELLKQPLENFTKITTAIHQILPVTILSHDLPAILRNHGADMATTCLIAMVMTMGLYVHTLNSINSGNEKNVLKKTANKFFGGKEGTVRSGALLGMALSMFFALDELFLIDHYTKGMASFQGANRGDWGDVLSYSTPLIAGAIYLSYDIARNVARKIKAPTPNPHPPTETA